MGFSDSTLPEATFVPEDILKFRGYDSQLPERTSALLVQARNGVFAFGRLMVGESIFMEVVKRLRPNPPAGLNGLKDFNRKTQLFFRKIPQPEVSTAASFFRDVYLRYSSEAIVFTYFSPHKGGLWKYVPPPQEVTENRLRWTDPGSTPEGWVLIGSNHSHGAGIAGHSSTDDDDELQDWNGVHTTFGRFSRYSAQLDISTSVVINSNRFIIDFDDIAESPPTADFPSEWLGEVTHVDKIE